MNTPLLPDLNTEFKPLAVWRAYVPLALRTEPKLKDLQLWWGVQTDTLGIAQHVVDVHGGDNVAQAWTRMLHATVGLSTETFELQDCSSEENFLEECGDVAWYAAQAFVALELLAPLHSQELVWCTEDLQARPIMAAYELIKSLKSFVQDAKRVVFYRRADLLPRLSSKLIDILLCLNVVGEQNAQVRDFEGLLESNVSKLQKRYPEGYSDWHARAREDKAPGDDDVDA